MQKYSYHNKELSLAYSTGTFSPKIIGTYNIDTTIFIARDVLNLGA
jgi:hypothetical protein